MRATIAAVRTAVLERRRRLEAHAERRFPAVYDARHAVRGAWPLVGPLLTGLLLIPVVALLGLIDLPDVHLPSVDLPSVDLPTPPLPDITLPGWLRAVFDAIGAVLHYVFVAILVALGVHGTVAARRRRADAERLGRAELARRLAVALGGVERRAHERGADRVADVSLRRDASVE